MIESLYCIVVVLILFSGVMTIDSMVNRRCYKDMEQDLMDSRRKERSISAKYDVLRERMQELLDEEDEE